jgi:hypothetical protein
MAGRMQGKLRLLFMVACSSVAGFSSAGTPQQALVEIATASKAATVERHLPVLLRQTLQQLSPEDRALAEQKLLIGHTLIPEGTQLIVPDDGQSLLVMEKKGSDDRLVIRVIHEINAGGEALLELGVEHSENYTQSVFVWMRLEEDEWRVAQVDVPRVFERFAFDDPEFAKRFRNVRNKEIAGQVLGIMYSLSGAVRQFSIVYVDVGYPENLRVLGPAEENSDADEQHAGLLQPEMAVNQFDREGYSFRYELESAGSDGDFAIVARPINRRPGARSYFLDASGTMRFTEEDRDPTEDDQPLN